MIRSRTALFALLPVLLHAFAREADRGLGLVLRAEIEPAGLLVEIGRAMAVDGFAAAGRVGLWLVAAAAAWLALAWRRRRRRLDPTGWIEAFPAEAVVFTPLLLRPAITLLALLAAAVRPSYPYGFTLPVALTQDWGIGQDLAALAALLALLLPALRFPAPRAGEVFFLSFLAYAILVPDWAWRWAGHPGNEPKYLRQAVALGHGLTFDAEGVSASMEELPARPLGQSIPAAASILGREAWAMAVALARGEVGRDAIRATRITRQTIRGKSGGVYYVLAPGPSLMLAPALRLDRAVNLWRGEPGRVAVAVLLWCAFAALLVTALFRLVRDATGRPGLGAALALGSAFVPPFLFYHFQFYPEMVGALVLAIACRTLALRPEGLHRHPWLFGSLLATLPWFHQKFLPVWLVLVATALVRRAGAPSRARLAAGLLVPTLISLYLTALYNFAITGSIRPDALFLAWGPGGVTSARVGQGVFGLLLDARYGILPYVPVLILASAGLATGGARRLGAVAPAALVYYLTVASADNWAGAVCNLGRYFMPVAPLAVALVALAIDETTDPWRRGPLALVLALAAWTGLFAVALWRDPLAASDSALLLAKSSYADGNQYLPNLFIRHWKDAAPGLWARIAVWVAGLGAIAGWWRRVSAREAEPRGASPCATLAAVTALVLSAGLFLERWPGTRAAPAFADAMAIPGEGGAPLPLVFVTGAARMRQGEAVLGPGAVELLLRAHAPVHGLPVTVGGQAGVLRAEGLPPVVLRPTGALARVPFFPYHEVRGRDGQAVSFTRARLLLTAEAVLRLSEPGSRPSGTAPPEGEMEPEPVGDR